MSTTTCNGKIFYENVAERILYVFHASLPITLEFSLISGSNFGGINFANAVFWTINAILWKSKRSFVTITELWKFIYLFVIPGSFQLVFLTLL